METVSDEHGKCSIRIVPKSKRGTVENGVHIHWLTGVLQGRLNWQIKEGKEDK